MYKSPSITNEYDSSTATRLDWRNAVPYHPTHPWRDKKRMIDIPRTVYYHLVDEPNGTYDYPTFIFAHACYPVVLAIFSVLVGADNDTGIARKFLMSENLAMPTRMEKSMWWIEVSLVDLHPDFLSLEESCLLMEHLMCKYGGAIEIKRVSWEEVLNV